MSVLSEDQDLALNEILDFLMEPDEGEICLSGPGGTGKTHLTKHLLPEAVKALKFLQLVSKNNALTFFLTSSTNKAAQVLFEATGLKASTIHSLLGLRPVRNYDDGTERWAISENSVVIQNALIIIDEASMVNKDLLQIIRQQTHNCKLIFIGDAYQLAPVRESVCPAFEDVKQKVQLTKIHRQATGNPIIEYAAKFRRALDTGIFPKIESHGSQVKLVTGPEMMERIDAEFSNITNANQARILAWTNRRVNELNRYARKLNTDSADYLKGELLSTNKPIVDTRQFLHFSTDAICEVTKCVPATAYGMDGWNITLEDAVTVFQVRNQEEVKPFLDKFAAQCRAKVEKWRDFYTAKDMLSDLRPIYSCTVAKSQGSTYKTIYIDVTNIGKNTKKGEIARLMYVALSRASHQIIMNGDLPNRLYL